MDVETDSTQPGKWLGLPVIATIARLLCRELTLQSEYLRLENRILRSKIEGRIPFTDNERRSLVDAALAMGKKLMETVVNIVKPATILAWQRRLEKAKWDYSERRRRTPGRPRTAANIEPLICQLARENTWAMTAFRASWQNSASPSRRAVWPTSSGETACRHRQIARA